MARPSKNNYLDKEELREAIIKYNRLNPKDNGEWLERYEKTVRTRAKGDKAKLQELSEFLEHKKELYKNKREYTAEWTEVESKLVGMFDALIRHRLPCFKVPIEDIEDVYSECMYALLKYISRYDERQDTSAFAYVTQICSNAIKLWLDENAQSMFCRLPMDIIDNGIDGNVGHSEYYSDEDYKE